MVNIEAGWLLLSGVLRVYAAPRCAALKQARGPRPTAKVACLRNF
jgi:hypothetical protein